MITDPEAKLNGDVVTISQKSGNVDADLVKPTEKRESVMVFDRPGEYEVGGVGIMGLRKGEEMTFGFHLDGLNIVHLGTVNGELSEKQIDEIGPIDILLVPADGQGAKVIKDLNPSIAIPMGEMGAIAELADKLGAEKTPVEKLTVGRDDLPEETSVVILA